MQAPGHRHHNGASACTIPLSCNPWVLDHMQLRDHVLAIAESIHAGGWDRARHLLELLRRRVSSTGGATERLAACFVQALAVRYSRLSSGTGAVSPSPQYFPVHVPTYFNVEKELSYGVQCYEPFRELFRTSFTNYWRQSPMRRSRSSSSLSISLMSS